MEQNILHGLSSRDKKLLFEAGTVIPFVKDQLILAEGEPGNSTYCLLSGNAEVSKQIGGSKETLRVLKEGELFGEMALFESKSRRTAAVRATSPGTVLRLELNPAHILESFIEPGIAIQVLKNLIRHSAARLEDPVRIVQNRMEESDTVFIRLNYEDEKLIGEIKSLARMGNASADVNYASGAGIIAAGKKNRDIFLLEKGTVLMVQPGQKKIEYVAPAIIGVYSALNEEIAVHGFAASSAATLHRIRIRKVLAKSDPAGAVKLLRKIGSALVSQTLFVEAS